jgi:hypothetical protein
MHDFEHRTFSSNNGNNPKPRPFQTNQTSGVKALVQERQRADLKNLACVLLELFFPSKFRHFVAGDCAAGRERVARHLVEKESAQIPRCVRRAVAGWLCEAPSATSSNNKNNNSGSINPEDHLNAFRSEFGVTSVTSSLLAQPMNTAITFPQYFPKVS